MKSRKSAGATRVIPSKTKQRNIWFPWQSVVLTFLLLLLPPQNLYALRAMSEVNPEAAELPPPKVAPYPVKTGNVPLELTAEGIVVVDEDTNVKLFTKNPETRFFPASTTKIMTALITLEDYKLTDVVTVGNISTEGQMMNLVPGETMTVENLLYGILVHSANDAALALADHHIGGRERFIERMNEKAQTLHLTNTHFTNPIGLDDPNHYTTPEDLASLSLYSLKNPVISKIVGVPQITVADTLYQHFHVLKNVNELVGKIPGVAGLKTGWTENAGQSLVTTIMRNGRKVLIVLLKSQDRFSETETVLNWVFNNFVWQEFRPTS